jgi:flagellar biosynthesis GTPase FlhF
MEKELNIKFEFPINLTEKKEEKEKFVLEGFAVANDFNLHNSIISDKALKKCIVSFKKEGKVCLQHDVKNVIGKLIECSFIKGKIWVKLEITDKKIIEKIKSGELNCLSIQGQIIKFEKVELKPDLTMLLIKDLHLIEVSLVYQGADPEAKAIRWYIEKAIEMAEKNMEKKNLQDEIEENKIEDEETEDEETEDEETEDEETEDEETEDEETEDEETELSEKSIIYNVMNSNSIDLSDNKNLSEFKKELLRVGSWYHGASKDGVLKVTKKMLKIIVKNFKDRVLDNVFVPLGHPTTDDPSKNVGEVKDLSLSKDGNKIIATVDVKEKGIPEKIKKGLIKGISASFVEDYIKKDNGEHVGPTLFHAALVNEPYIKGMEGFVPLSDDYKDSLIIPILNIDVPTVLSEMEKRIKELEEKENIETSEESPKEEIKTEEGTQEETQEESSEKLNEESPEEETSEEETSKVESSEETEPSKVGTDTEEEVEEEIEDSKPEESETEESEIEEDSEEVEDNDVELSEAEKLYDSLLRVGKITPAEKDLLIPLLASNAKVELAEGKVNLRDAMKKYLNSRSPIFSLDEFGTVETNSKKAKTEEIPDDIKEELVKMGFEDEDVQKEAYEEFKKGKERKELGESTPF